MLDSASGQSLPNDVSFYFVIFQEEFTIADKEKNDNFEIPRKKLIVRGSCECSQLSADQCNNSEENQERETGECSSQPSNNTEVSGEVGDVAGGS